MSCKFKNLKEILKDAGITTNREILVFDYKAKPEPGYTGFKMIDLEDSEEYLNRRKIK